MAWRDAGRYNKPIQKKANALKIYKGSRFMADENSIHGGHRNRMKTRYLRDGLDTFEDHTVLELLLYYTIPRQDVNELAHRLINTFGSLHSVFDAEVSDLVKVNGIGENTALLIKLTMDINRRCLISKISARKDIYFKESELVGEYFKPYFSGEKEEKVYVACLDAQLKLIKCRKLFDGGINSAVVSTRKIIETALADKATNIIMAHNHPTGLAIPSYDDRDTTVRIAKALKAVEIRLLDHFIIAGDEFVSMHDSGYFQLL
jgi:DNA repair protein RadC